MSNIIQLMKSLHELMCNANQSQNVNTNEIFFSWVNPLAENRISPSFVSSNEALKKYMTLKTLMFNRSAYILYFFDI